MKRRNNIKLFVIGLLLGATITLFTVDFILADVLDNLKMELVEYGNN